MGGSIGWTLRLSNGEEYRMQRWTNIFPDTIDDEFLKENPISIQESLASWLDMKKDWEENKKTGNYREFMTDVYAPYPYGLKPSEYGIIVTDFVTKTLISCNDYTKFGSMILTKNFKTSNPDRWAYHERLLKAGRFNEYFVVSANNNSKWKSIPVALLYLPLEEFIDKIKMDDIFGFVKVTPAPGWNLIETNPDTKDGREAAFEAIRNILPMNRSEIAAFKRWIKETDS